jgi:hypothetical protein
LPPKDLLAEAEAFNQFLIAADILLVKVNKQSSALANDLQQAALGVEIMAIGRHVAGELVYPFRKHGYLDFG